MVVVVTVAVVALGLLLCGSCLLNTECTRLRLLCSIPVLFPCVPSYRIG